MIDMAVQQVLLSLLGMSVTGIVTYLATKTRALNSGIKALMKIERSHARMAIMDSYEAYIIEGKHMTVERFEQVTEIYEGYCELGGNGTAKRMYEELAAKRPWIVKD